MNGDGLIDWVVACGDDPEPAQAKLWWCGSSRYVDQYDDAYIDPPVLTQTGLDAPDHWLVFFNTGAGLTADPHLWELPRLDSLVNDPDFILIIGLSRVEEGLPWSSSCGVSMQSSDNPVASFQASPVYIAQKRADSGSGGPRTVSVPMLNGGCQGIESLNQAITYMGDAGGGGPQAVKATLLDYDGDGRPDFVDFEMGIRPARMFEERLEHRASALHQQTPRAHRSGQPPE